MYSQKDAEESDIARERAAQAHVRRLLLTRARWAPDPMSPAAVGADLMLAVLLAPGP